MMMRFASLLLVLGVVACGSKKADRDQLCSTAKTVLTGGLKDQADQLEKSGDKDDAALVRTALGSVDKKWDGVCHDLSDKEIDCVSKGAEAVSDPDCKSAVDKMKTLVGM